MKAVLVASLAAALSFGCGDDGDGGGGGSGSGLVVEPWTAYCVATFTRDHTVIDVFDEPDLTVSAGEQYLLSAYGDGGFGSRVEIAYLTPKGPVDFEIEVAEGEALPFTSNCEPGATELMYGVFADTVLYEDEALTVEACTLTAGTAVPTSGAGSRLVSDLDFFGDTPQIYELTLVGLSELCGDREKAFVEGGWSQVGDTQHGVRPIATFVGPPSE